MAAILLVASLATFGAAAPLPPAPDCGYLWERAAPACNDGDPYNGYWWRGAWVPGYPDLDTVFARMPIWTHGRAVRYDPGVMEATARANGLDLAGYVDGVAVPFRAELGHPAWVRPDGMDWQGPFLIVDVPRRGDFWPIVAVRGIVVELGYRTAQRWGIGDADHVQVSLVPPADLPEAGRPIWLAGWIKANGRSTWDPDEGPGLLWRPPAAGRPGAWRIRGEWSVFPAAWTRFDPLDRYADRQ